MVSSVSLSAGGKLFCRRALSTNYGFKMKGTFFCTSSCILIAWSVCVTSAYLVDDNPYRHFVTLDPDGKYNLEWLVDWNEKRVIFNVSVTTKGYVGLGLAKRGTKMVGADIVIGGVYPNGQPYFTDRHAIGNQLPEVDASQDWTLHHAWQHGGTTFLSFSRPFDTCDKEHDIPITDDALTLIWAYSEIDDQLQYHFQNRGGYPVYLLDPDLVPREIDPIVRNDHWKKNPKSDMNLYRITQSINLPTQDTVYWCTFHKAPTKSKKHIIGWNTVFPTEKDRGFVHHMLLHRCRAPAGVDPDDLFAGPARSKGTECYFVASTENSLPTSYCRETIHVWGVNGRSIFFPESIGLKMSESGTEYFLLQVHYDNPNVIPDVNVTVSIDAYYTDKLRENEAGVLQLGETIPGTVSVVIPPSSLDHVIMGHCGPGCSERIIPPGGINLFAVFMHTHLAGRGVRTLHHRGSQELPWILGDDNYNFNYQQFRVLREERLVLPGDLISNRCVYDTTDRNGSVVVGGFSTREEMCTSLIYYHTRLERHGACRSEIRSRDYWNLLGIRNATWDRYKRKVVVTSPPQFAGMTVEDYANNHIKWDLQTREAIQRHHVFTPQWTTCPRVDTPPQISLGYYDDHFGVPGHGQFGQPRRRLQRYSPTTRHFDEHEGPGWGQSEEETGFETFYPRGSPKYRRPPQCARDERNPWLTVKSVPKKKSLSSLPY